MRELEDAWSTRMLATDGVELFVRDTGEASLLLLLSNSTALR